MKLSDIFPWAFSDAENAPEDRDVNLSTKKFSSFNVASGEGIEGVGLKDGQNVRFALTTDSVQVNPNPFRNSKGQFIGTPEELEALKNQRDVNEFLYNAINDIEQGDIDLEGYATEVQLNEVDTASIERDENLQDQIDTNKVDSESGDQELQDQIDNIAGALPEDPNKSGAINIGDQVAKITGNRPSGAGGEAGNVLIWKAETGGPASPYNECKFIVPDTSIIDLDVKTLWFKQGNKVQQWNLSESGWFTSGNVLHYSAISCDRDELVDGDPVELWYEDPADAPAEYFEVISRSESKADDAELRELIEGIEFPETDVSGLVSKTGGDDMEGPLVIKAQDPSDGRATNRVQTLGVYSQSEGSALRLGTTRDRVYIGHDDTSFNGPIKVDEIQAKNDTGVQLTNEGTKDDHLITKGYVDGGDKQLQVEIDQIALALETLLVQREHGQWKYVGFSGDNIPRNAGEFSLAGDDIASSQDNIITINQEDLKGITHGFGDVEVGDYVEIVNTEDPTSYALFVVTKAPEGTGIVNVEVALKDTGYNIWIGETCEIRFFAVNEQDINLTDLDNRYLKLSGGTMDGGAVLKVNTLEPVNLPFIYYEGDPDNTHAAGLINRYMMNQYAVNKAGDTMTGILELPRFNVKKHDGEAICLIEGKVDGTASSARLTFSNKINANAYGNLTWNGNSGQGWFQFNKDVDFSTRGLHSVNNIRMVGNKTIQEAQTTRIKFDNKVVIPKTGTNKAGFVLKGGVNGNSDGNLLSVWHNSSGLDSVDYYGKQEGENNVATVGYVNSKVGSGGGSPVTAKIQAGIQMWSASRLAEGCFNLLDESNSTTSNCKVARGLTFHTYHSYDAWPWMKWDLRSGGQIHLTDMNGKYLMSKPVLSVEKYDAGSGDNPEDALWFFELSIYGFESETSLSGLYMVEFENCLEAS